MPYANKTTNIFRSTFKMIYTCWRWVMLALILQGEMCITKKYKGETESSDRVSKVSLAEVPSKSIKAVYIQRRAARRTPGLVQPSFSCWSFTYCSEKYVAKIPWHPVSHCCPWGDLQMRWKHESSVARFSVWHFIGKIDVLSHATSFTKGKPSSRTWKSCWWTIHHPSIIIEKSEDLKGTFNANTWAFIEDLPAGGSGLEFPKHELPDQRSCLIKGVDPCRFLTHGCPDVWLTNQVYFFTMLPKHHTEASYLHYIDKYAVCSWSTSWIHSFQAELKPKSES